MPLLHPTQKFSKRSIKLQLNKGTLDEVQQYCAWAGLENQEDFFEQAARLIFQKDKAWKNYLAQPQNEKDGTCKSQ